LTGRYMIIKISKMLIMMYSRQA